MAVAVSGHPPAVVERLSLPWRGVRLGQVLMASLRARHAAAAVTRRLRAAQLLTWRIDIGIRSDGYAIGIGHDKVRLAPETVVVAAREYRRPSLLEQAIGHAEHELDAKLMLRAGRVLSTGALMAELSEPGQQRWLLRMADQTMSPTLTAAHEAVELVLGSNPPAGVSRRMLRPTAAGAIGPLAWALEEKRPGSHPHRMSPGVWDECIAFLADLASMNRPPTAAPSLEADAAVLSALVDERGRRMLELMARQAEAELSEVPRCWGHGDFHPGNLLVAGERLTTVLDWDAASPSALPGLDLLHLIATTDPALRALPLGMRCTRGLLSGDDERGQRYFSAVGIPMSPSKIQALTHAYWLTRIARELRTFPDRHAWDSWLELNLRRPLTELGGSLAC